MKRLILNTIATMSYASYAKHLLPLCNRTQIINGAWKPHKNPTNNTPHDHKDSRPPCVDTYEWVPVDSSGSLCEFTSWSEQLFCQVTHGETILFIGDSTSREHFYSLVLPMKDKKPIFPWFQQTTTNQTYGCGSSPRPTTLDGKPFIGFNTMGYSICNDHTQVWVHLCNALCHVPLALFAPPSQDFPDYHPTIVIMNRGSWYREDEELRHNIRTNLQFIRTWLQNCDRNNISCRFFWRTTVPGHPDCYQRNSSSFPWPIRLTEPVNNLTLIETYINYTYTSLNINRGWKWDHFQHQNQLVLDILLQSNLSSLDILDAYYLNVRRPDLHASPDDCLHNCLPGKVVVFNQLLLHYLQSNQQPKVDD
jgi:hypothetical protein